MKRLLLILLFVIFLSSNFLYAQQQEQIFTMFYNVENLFDTIDDPRTNDNDFLPTSSKQWDTEKYNHKLKQLTKVFDSINNGIPPDIIGLCEVENEFVVQDLIRSQSFDNNQYTVVHQDSPDFRGIDCAVIFNNQKFDLLFHEFIQVKIPDSERPTRDILYVQLNSNGETLHIFINHWPSRWGGQEITERKRVFAAEVLRNYIDKNTKENDNIIIMGDFNDYPSDKSVNKILVKEDFTNLMGLINGDDIGSYNYNNQWGFLDHIIVSDNLLNQRSNLQVVDFNVFNRDWMMYTNTKGKKKPNRTYGGDSWYKGFSDHLPVYCIFSFVK